MILSDQEKKVLNKRLEDLVKCSERSLVSLRKGNSNTLDEDIKRLAVSITAFVIDGGASVFPVKQANHSE